MLQNEMGVKTRDTKNQNGGYQSGFVDKLSTAGKQNVLNKSNNYGKKHYNSKLTWN